MEHAIEEVEEFIQFCLAKTLGDNNSDEQLKRASKALLERLCAAGFVSAVCRLQDDITESMSVMEISESDPVDDWDDVITVVEPQYSMAETVRRKL